MRMVFIGVFFPCLIGVVISLSVCVVSIVVFFRFGYQWSMTSRHSFPVTRHSALTGTA